MAREAAQKREINGNWERNCVMKERGALFTATENQYTGYTVHDDAGEKIGEVEDSLVSENNHTEYIRIKTRTLELRSTLIPMNMAHVNEQRQLVEVSASRESVLGAPTFDDNLDGEESKKHA